MKLSTEIKLGEKGSGRIYLVYTDIYSFHGFPYHAGLASLAAVLLQNGYEVKVGYLSSEDQYEDIVQEVLSFQPEVVGFTTVETQLIFVQRLATLIKSKHSCVTVVGGTHITLWPNAIVEPESYSLDCGMQGDSEMALLDLVGRVHKGEDYFDVKNLCYRHPKTGELTTNPLYPQISRLEDLPHPATEVFDYQGMINETGRALFHFNRGCPYPCTYCSARELALQYGSVKDSLQKRSVESTIEEIRLTVEKYDMPSETLLMFTDDLFTLDKKWLYAFLELYEKEIARPFFCTTRANLVTGELFDRMKSAGCDEVMMSIESGNTYIRNNVMKRGMSKRQLFNAFDLANKFGLKSGGPCIIGLPFETPEMIEDSIYTVSQLNVYNAGINIFFPYRGTSLRSVCEKNGFMPDATKAVIERRESILNLPTVSKDQIQYYHDNWHKLIYAHQGVRQQCGYAIKSALKVVAKTKYGGKIQATIERNPVGKKLKDYGLGAFGIS